MDADTIRQWIAQDQVHRFYDSTAWRKKRREVLKAQKGECQICKARGKYRKATIVHHVQHLKDRPDLALTSKNPETGAPQLVALCKKCHEEQHPEARFKENRWKYDEKW